MAIPQAITDRRPQIEALCRQHSVRRLELFGSAVGESFDLEASDLDFLVEFHVLPEGSRADAYFDLREGLADLFQREIDLLVVGAVRNPYFLERIRGERATLYAA